MKGNDEVIQVLQDVLCAELTAVNQYFIHARMCENWGYNRLAAHVRKESIEEMQHAQKVIDRILYFDGAPNMQKYMKINVGRTVPEQFQFDLEVEYQAVPRLNKGIEVARALGDNGTRALLEEILADEEDLLAVSGADARFIERRLKNSLRCALVVATFTSRQLRRMYSWISALIQWIANDTRRTLRAGSKRFTAFIRPMLPSWIRSACGRP